MSGATEVACFGTYIPASSTGWNMMDITDYDFNGSQNLVVEVLWGDNGYWTSTYYRTYKTAASSTRMLYGYADSETPPNYDGAASYINDMRFYFYPLTAPAQIEGYVMNGGGLSIAGADVGIPGGAQTVTDNSGYDILVPVP